LDQLRHGRRIDLAWIAVDLNTQTVCLDILDAG
jgi:hypothetical protein